jgi:uncharacterized MAPEG superfamily protein
MSGEMNLLIWAAALTFVQALVAAAGANLRIGLPALAGNRDNLPQISGWAGRAQRAHRNMLENLILFAILVLVAQIAGKTNAATALGAQLFFWARVVYLLVYLVGIPWVRTGVWLISVIGLVLIFQQIV